MRRILAVIVALSCVATSVVVAAAVVPECAPSCIYRTGHRAMEPSIAVLKDGSVLYQAWELNGNVPGGVPPQPRVLRFDGGTWSDASPGPVDAHLASLDPFLYHDADTGRVFSLDWIAAAIPYCSTLSFSDNGGDSWTTSPLACGGFDGESIAAGPPVSNPTVAYPNIVYYCTSASLGSGEPITTPSCSKSLDGGVTFVPTGGLPFEATGGTDVFPGWTGNPVVGDDRLAVAISRDEGLTWTRVRVATNGSAGAATRMAIAGDGMLAYTWIGNDHLPYVATSTDRGATWSAPRMFAPAGVNETALARVAATPDGRLAIAYVGTTESPGAPWYSFCNPHLGDCVDGPYEGVAWSGYVTTIDGPDVTTVDTGTIFEGGCSADGACKAVLDFVDIAFAPDGDAWAAFVDDCAITRDFTPVFSPGLGNCADGVGEGIVLRVAA
jgi:hypothetical protein